MELQYLNTWTLISAHKCFTLVCNLLCQGIHQGGTLRSLRLSEQLQACSVQVSCTSADIPLALKDRRNLDLSSWPHCFRNPKPLHANSADFGGVYTFVDLSAFIVLHALSILVVSTQMQNCLFPGVLRARGLPVTMVNLAMGGHCQMSSMSAAKPTPKCHSSRRPASYVVTRWVLGTAFPPNGPSFHLHRNEHCSQHVFAFPSCEASANTTSQSSLSVGPTSMGSHIVSRQTRGPTFQPRQHSRELTTRGQSRLSHISRSCQPKGVRKWPVRRIIEANA